MIHKRVTSSDKDIISSEHQTKFNMEWYEI